MANPKIQLRHDTAANWTSVNPVLLEGEVGVEITSQKDTNVAFNSRQSNPLVVGVNGVISNFLAQTSNIGTDAGNYIYFNQYPSGDYTWEVTFSIDTFGQQQVIIHQESAFTAEIKPTGILQGYNFTTATTTDFGQLEVNKKYTLKIVATNNGQDKTYYLNGEQVGTITGDTNVDLTDTYPHLGLSSYYHNGMYDNPLKGKIYLAETFFNDTPLFVYDKRFKIGDGTTAWSDLDYQAIDITPLEDSIDQLEQDYGSLIDKVDDIEQKIPVGYVAINPIEITEGRHPYTSDFTNLHYSSDKGYCYDALIVLPPSEGFSSTKGFILRFGLDNFLENPARIYLYYPSPELFIGFNTNMKITFGSQHASLQWFKASDKTYGYEMILNVAEKTFTANIYRDAEFTNKINGATINLTDDNLNLFLNNYLKENISITYNFYQAGVDNYITVNQNTSGGWVYSPLSTEKDGIQLSYDNNTLKVNDSGQLYTDISSMNQQLSGLSLPDVTKVTELTLGASGTTYTAPGNGYFFLDTDSNNNTGYIEFVSPSAVYYEYKYPTYTTTQPLQILFPCLKGDIVTVVYQNISSRRTFKFIYASGEEVSS